MLIYMGLFDKIRNFRLHTSQKMDSINIVLILHETIEEREAYYSNMCFNNLITQFVWDKEWY